MAQPFSSREDIKGDLLQEYFRLVLEWIAAHRQTFFSIVGTAAIVIAVAAFITANFRNLRRQAWERYSQGQNWTQAGRLDNALGQYDDVIANFSKTPAAAYALLAKGDILYQQKKYPEAIEAFKTSREKNPPKLVLPFVLQGLGMAQEDSGDIAGAVATYKEFVAEFQDHFLAPKVYESLGRAYELSRNADAAKEIYEKIITMFPSTLWSEKARVRYQALAPQPFQTGSAAQGSSR